VDFPGPSLYAAAMRLTLLLLLLTACARAPLSAQQSSGLDQISAISFLGNSFTVDLKSRALIRSREAVLDVAPWKIDEAFSANFQTALSAGKKTFIPFALDSTKLERALVVRESRWEKVAGKQSQALLDLLFATAEGQGIRYFFLAIPGAEHEAFPSFRGVMGTACATEAGKSRSFVYFFARFTLWDVSRRKKLYEEALDPSLTKDTSYADCSVAAEITDPAHALEDPAKRTLDRLVRDLVARVGI
jgi:hypothetical protein